MNKEECLEYAKMMFEHPEQLEWMVESGCVLSADTSKVYDDYIEVRIFTHELGYKGSIYFFKDARVCCYCNYGLAVSPRRTILSLKDPNIEGKIRNFFYPYYGLPKISNESRNGEGEENATGN